MKKGEKKKRRKAPKRRTASKQAHRQARAAKRTTVLHHIRHARNYPIEDCWVQPGWDEDGLAVIIIYGGIEYAAQFGFRPHSDFKRSRYILDPPDLHPHTGAAEFGHDGKPFYIEDPHDNVNAILRQLARTAGEGNFHYLMQIAGPPPDEWDE